MAPTTTIRKTIGVLKDQTSISIAKVAGNIAPDLEVLIVKATTHDQHPTHDKYITEILNLMTCSNAYVNASVVTISKRLSKTHDWIVAVKGLMLLHRLFNDGPRLFQEEIVYAQRKGMRVLDMNGFKDQAHSNSWDQSVFVKVYGSYLDVKVEFSVYENKLERKDEERADSRFGGDGEFGHDGRDSRRRMSYSDADDLVKKEQKKSTPMREMKPERVLDRLKQIMRLMDRILSCRLKGLAKNSGLVLAALYLIVKDSFGLYVEICEALAVLTVRFGDMEYNDCAKCFDAYVSAAQMIDELIGFYRWCEDAGIARSSEFPKVQRISDELLGTLENFLKGMRDRPRNLEKPVEEKIQIKEEPEPNINEIKALPAPENCTPPPPPPPEPEQPKPQPQPVTEELINLRDDGVTADEQGNKFALALFSGQATTNTNGAWEAFPSNMEPEVQSAWQTPAAESGKADWELALVETASNLSKQKAALAGGFDSLLLNGMYDQGAVRQHVSTSQLSGGSSSSVAFPIPGKSATQMLALPAPDGTVQPVGNHDPFAASLTVPPPSYVQMAEMEQKQQLLVHEQQQWQQYGQNGMQGQVALSKLGGGGPNYYSPQQMMPYGMPGQVNGMGQAGYYMPQGPY
ncbi:hypothetical protein ACFE04_002347 [Oxalis oulophora]